MTIAFWLATGQTVTFLAAVAWAWWASGRIADLMEAAKIIKEHSETAALNANRAADRGMTTLLDARQMLDVLADWWNELRDAQPATQPYPVVGPDTMPETEAVRLIEDFELAWEVARLEQIMRGDKPSPRPRKAKA